MVYLYLFILVQVVAESFPISSSGHTRLLEGWWKLFSGGVRNRVFLPSVAMHQIDAFLHFPTMMIVAWWYKATWWVVVVNVRRCWRIIVKMIFFTVVTDSITVIFFYMRHQGCYPPLPLWAGFLITALLLFSVRFLADNFRPLRCFDLWLSVLLGIAQGIALFPGISRFAITYVVARWYGCRSVKSFAISWMVYWPLMCAAVIKSIYDLYHRLEMVSVYMGDVSFYGVIMVSSGIGYAAFAGAAYLAQRDQLWRFGYYLILPFLLSLVWC